MRGDRSGFTLLEVLVATTLLAMMAGFLAVAFRLAAASVSRGEETIREAARLRAVVGVLERAVRSADPMPLPGAEPPAPFFRGERDRLRLLTASPPSGIAGEGLRLLALRKSGNGVLSLWDASPFRVGADRWDGGGEGEGHSLLPGVTSISFSYSSGPDGTGHWEWKDSWDGAEEGSLPAAVRLELTTSPPGGTPRTTAFVAPVPAGG